VYGPSITARLVASIGDEIALGALPPFLQWIGPRDYDRPWTLARLCILECTLRDAVGVPAHEV